ncbi:hypothetical protein G7Y89_g13434 [Cudoniella acicularis]|uniref:Uncharacterized protein n=1 Tax=Cudoniella acicularis TaxID=354080 RepID=A0A8H4VY88_9HELO|nr:hypothetical protein G7Y89_g13434 [Cudoniella acicularis]
MTFNNSENDSPKRTKRRLDLRAPMKMVGFMLAGLGLAIIHHFYYASLRDSEALSDTGLYIWNTGSQEWKIRYGTALAFVSKTAMAAAISYAYQEHLWRTLQKKAITIRGLDAASIVLDNLSSLFNAEYISKAKIGAVLVVLTWLLPLSTLVAPATLTVKPYTRLADSIMPVPVLNLSGHSEVDTYGIQRGRLLNIVLSRLALTTALQQSIVPIPVIVPNSSYNLSFSGPSLKCETPNTQNITDLINEAVNTGDMGLDYDLPPDIAYSPRAWRSLYYRSDFLWLWAAQAPYVCTIQRTSFVATFATFADSQRIDKDYQWAWEELVTTDFYYDQLMAELIPFFTGYVGLTREETVVNMTTAELMEEFSRNMTLSLFSVEQAWSSTPQNTTVRTATQLNVFAYNERNLLLAYGLAFCACLGSVAVGLRAYYLNGTSYNSSFSSIVSTTRNSTLDILTEGRPLGPGKLDKNIEQTQLIFGILDNKEKGGLPRSGFGLPSEIRPEKRGKPYW